MSTLSNLLSLFFPARCLGCGKLLKGRMEWICTRCQGSIPLTNFHKIHDNLMFRKLSLLCPVVKEATAQYQYFYDGMWRKVLHHIKYKNSRNRAFKIGYIYGCELRESPLYKDVNLIVPVPLHPFRQMQRGYNQSEIIARGIAKAMGVKVNCTSLKRHHNNISQTQTEDQDSRWLNVQGIFSVRTPKKLSNKNILLVDDVITTGATVTSCINTIVSATENTQISVATLAISVLDRS